MELGAEILRYMMSKASVAEVVLLLVIWWGYKLLLRKEEVIDGVSESIVGLKEQIANNRETQAKLITLLENLIYGKRNHE
jgi:hypothetical protein